MTRIIIVRAALLALLLGANVAAGGSDGGAGGGGGGDGDGGGPGHSRRLQQLLKLPAALSLQLSQAGDGARDEQLQALFSAEEEPPLKELPGAERPRSGFTTDDKDAEEEEATKRAADDALLGAFFLKRTTPSAATAAAAATTTAIETTSFEDKGDGEKEEKEDKEEKDEKKGPAYVAVVPMQAPEVSAVDPNFVQKWLDLVYDTLDDSWQAGDDADETAAKLKKLKEAETKARAP